MDPWSKWRRMNIATFQRGQLAIYSCYTKCYAREIWQPEGCSCVKKDSQWRGQATVSPFQVWSWARYPLWTLGTPLEDGVAAKFGGKNTDSVVRQMWLPNLAPPLGALWESKLLRLSKPWFPHQQNRNNHNYPAQLGGFRVTMFMKHWHSAQHILGTQ